MHLLGGVLFVGGHDEAVAAAPAQLVVRVQLVQVVPRAQVGHALVVNIIRAGLLTLGVCRIFAVGGVLGHIGEAGQHGHAGVKGVSLVAVGRGRAVVFSVLVGEQGKETLTVLLRDPPAG